MKNYFEKWHSIAYSFWGGPQYLSNFPLPLPSCCFPPKRSMKRQPFLYSMRTYTYTSIHTHCVEYIYFLILDTLAFEVLILERLSLPGLIPRDNTLLPWEWSLWWINQPIKVYTPNHLLHQILKHWANNCLVLKYPRARYQTTGHHP